MYHKRNKLLVLSLYLGDYTRRFYLREISRLTKIPLKTTQNIISSLESDNILISIKEGKNKYFKLNLSNIEAKFYLLQAEIYKTMLFINKYSTFKSFLKDVKVNVPIIVFGSFANFAANKDSDVDLLVISNEQQKLPLHLIPYKVHEIMLSKKVFFKSVKTQEVLIKEIEEKHVILNNHSFFVNAMWCGYGK